MPADLEIYCDFDKADVIFLKQILINVSRGYMFLKLQYEYNCQLTSNKPDFCLE